MLINRSNLNIAFDGFSTRFNEAFKGAETSYQAISMVVPSSGRDEHYGWLGQIPSLREWIGPRHVKNLMAHTFTIKNRRFETTLSVSREDFEDDRFGVMAPLFAELGKAVAEHPDKLIFELLPSGFTALCYDGQPFFDTDHPVGVNEAAVSVSNVQSGGEAAWFLLDTSRAVKPFVYQDRVPYRLTALNQDEDENVFKDDEFLYGVRGRSNAGFGLWQLAFASKAELTADNYEAARAAMMAFAGDEGRPLGVKPDTMVVPPSLEGAALRLLNNGSRVVVVDDVPVAVQNEWAGTAKPIVTAWLT